MLNKDLYSLYYFYCKNRHTYATDVCSLYFASAFAFVYSYLCFCVTMFFWCYH